MINIERIRQEEEFMKRIKKVFENLLEEFKEDTHVLNLELVVSNESKKSSAIYIEMDVYLTGSDSEDDIITRVIKHTSNLEDWVILCLYVGGTTLEDNGSVSTYSLNTYNGINSQTTIKYANLGHYYGEGERYYSYDFKEVEEYNEEDNLTCLKVKELPRLNNILINRFNTLFSGYEYDNLEVVDYE